MKQLLHQALILVVILAIAGLVIFKNVLLEKMNLWSSSGLVDLRLENESLKAQLDQLPEEKSQWRQGLNYLPASVYSSYPFNNKKLIGINLGAEDGIAELMPVAITPGILFGQVIKVFPKYSLVRTIFDQDFKIPVRISWTAKDALLEGGNTPMVTMIKKELIVSRGDAVYSAGIEFPYWIKIGDLGLVMETDDEYFKQAELTLVYSSNEIKKVYVITNHAVR